MPSFDVEFEVFCSCGEGLCNQSRGENKRGYHGHSPCVTVEPCDKCKDKAADIGYDKGYQEGYDKGYADGSRESDNG